MRNTLLPLCTLLACGLAFTGCKKDKDDPAPAPTKTELLTGKNWKVTAATVDPAIDLTGTGVPQTNLYVQLDDCTKDDLMRFETPNVYKEDEGATKCTPTAPQTQTGTWTFNTDQTKVTTTLGSEVVTYDILELTSNTMRATAVENFGTPVNYTITLTLTKQ